MGRSSWDVWNEDYGALEAMAGVSDDPAGAPASGADRLLRSAQDERLVVEVRTLSDRPEAPAPPDPTEPEPEPEAEAPDGGKPAGIIGSADAGTPEPGEPEEGEAEPEPMDGDQGVAHAPADEPDDEGGGVILEGLTESARAVGAIRELQLSRHPDESHSHEWIRIRFLAAESDEPLHSYEVRVSAEPIVDERTFLMLGRPAKNATESDEGAVSLPLPAETVAGELVEGEIGDLSAETRYYVGVRAVDRFDRRGPISVARITTTKRTFATVTPCFVATAAYGTPLAREVGVLRRVRDRYLMSNEPGRRLVEVYYAHGEALARFLREHPLARHAGARRARADRRRAFAGRRPALTAAFARASSVIATRCMPGALRVLPSCSCAAAERAPRKRRAAAPAGERSARGSDPARLGARRAHARRA